MLYLRIYTKKKEESGVSDTYQNAIHEDMLYSPQVA